MAVRRGGSSPGGAVIGLVVVGLGFVVALSLAIVFYVQKADVQQQGQADREALESFAGQDRSSADVLEVQDRARQTPGRSVVRQLILDNDALRRAIGGTGATAAQTVEQVAALLAPSGATDLVAAYQQLAAQLATARAENGDLQRQVNAANQTIAEIAGQFDREKMERDNLAARLEMTLSALGDRQAQHEDRTTQSHTELQSRLDIARQDAEREIRARDENIRQLQQTIATNEQVIRQLRDIIGGDQPAAPDETRVADGRVIEVNSELGLVYIDLGRSDHLVLGTTFEVFDPGRGVLVDDNGALRGKASIEVVDIAQDSAACRVTRSTFGRPIVARDLLANLVYDRDRVFKFYVFGNFDLDGDGVYSVADADLIGAQIREWGGEVVDIQEREARLIEAYGQETADQTVLPLDTDFVVIGAEPTAPAPISDAIRDPIAIQRIAEANRLYTRYNQLTQEARNLGIPILNQNRFLALVGQRSR